MSERGLGTRFRRLWLAATISNLGDGIALTAYPLLAATLTRDPAQVAAVTAIGRLPWLLFALPGGVIADRMDRRRAMIVVDAARAAVVGGLALLVGSGRATLPAIYAFAFVLGSFETIFDNASQAMLPALVRREDLERANGRLFAAQTITNEFAGAPVGALLFATAAFAPFAADAATFALASLLVASIAGRYRPDRDRKVSIRAEIREGLAWLWRHPLLRTLALMLGVWNMTFIAALSVLVLFALDELRLGEVGYGLLVSAGAVGSLAGSVVASRLSRALGAGRSLVVCIFAGGVTQAAIAFAPNAPVAGALFAVNMLVGMIWNVITVSLRQELIPGRLFGRVNSVYRLLGWGTMPIGAALGGAVARPLGVGAPFVLGGALIVAMGFVAIPLLGNQTVTRAREAAAE